MSQYLFVNFDRKEYLRPQAFGEHADLKTVLSSYDGVLTGLAVLLADGNGRGGGDLRSDHPIIGTWAGERIALVDDQVLDAALSEVGLQDVPLQAQALRLGRDVSDLVVAAVVDGEGAYSRLSALNPRLLLSLPHQRSLPQAAAARLSRTQERETLPLKTLDDLFGVLGVSPGLSPSRAQRQLQAGLLLSAQALGRDERYRVLSLQMAWPHGEPWAINAPCEITVQLQDEHSGAAPWEFSFLLGEAGLSATAFFDSVFPGLVWERSQAQEPVSGSPFVAKLLQQVQNLKG